jgi:hypothetical protein
MHRFCGFRWSCYGEGVGKSRPANGSDRDGALEAGTFDVNAGKAQRGRFHSLLARKLARGANAGGLRPHLTSPSHADTAPPSGAILGAERPPLLWGGLDPPRIPRSPHCAPV